MKLFLNQSLNCHSCLHMGQCCCICWAANHFMIQCMWKQCLQRPVTEGEKRERGMANGRGQGKVTIVHDIVETVYYNIMDAFQRTSWLGISHIDSYELDLITPIRHYFSQWKIIIHHHDELLFFIERNNAWLV